MSGVHSSYLCRQPARVKRSLKWTDRQIVPRLWPMRWQRYSFILSPSLRSVSRKLSVVRHHAIGPQPRQARSHPLSRPSRPTDVTATSCEKVQGPSQAFMACEWQDRRSNPLLLCPPPHPPSYGVCAALCLSNYSPGCSRAARSRDTSKRSEAGLFSVQSWPRSCRARSKAEIRYTHFPFDKYLAADCGFYCYLNGHIILNQAILWSRSVTLLNYSPLSSDLIYFCYFLSCFKHYYDYNSPDDWAVSIKGFKRLILKPHY